MSQKRISTFFLPNPKIVKSSPQPNTEDQDQAPDKVATGTTAAIPASSQDASTDLRSVTSPSKGTATSPLPAEPFQPTTFEFPAKKFGTETFSRAFKTACRMQEIASKNRKKFWGRTPRPPATYSTP